jgi:hypothetical protein
MEGSDERGDGVSDEVGVQVVDADAVTLGVGVSDVVPGGVA